MDDEYFKKISKDVESGEYFKNAKEWYLDSYILPLSERSYFLLLIILVMIIGNYSYGIYTSNVPIKMNIPIVVKVEDQAKVFTKLVRLSSTSKELAAIENPDRLIVEYILKRLIKSNESYDYSDDFKNMSKFHKFVEQFSTKKIANNLKRQLSIRNSDSFILKYRSHTLRKIEVVDNSSNFSKEFVDAFNRLDRLNKAFKPKPNTVYSFTADFDAIEQNKLGKKISRWTAKIDFLYNPVSFNTNKGEFNPLSLNVVGYVSYPKDKK